MKKRREIVNDLIPATEKEKEEHLNYEIWMFYETCDQLNLPQETLFERNLLLESLPTHTRNLVGFFYNDKNKKYPQQKPGFENIAGGVSVESHIANCD